MSLDVTIAYVVVIKKIVRPHMTTRSKLFQNDLALQMLIRSNFETRNGFLLCLAGRLGVKSIMADLFQILAVFKFIAIQLAFKFLFRRVVYFILEFYTR